MSRLIDADALIYSICKNDCGIESPSDCIMYANNCCFNVDIVRNAPTVSGWISVKDRLPNDNKPVYVWLGRGSVLRSGIPFVGRYDPFSEGVWQIYGLDGDKSEIIKVTHWMPIEPPEEGV